MNLSQLTFTRFAFCAVVVFYHYGAPALIKLHPAAEPVFYYIHSFISYFFLLSGFILVISSSGKKGLPSDRKFWINRFARVYPLYAFALLLSVLLTLALGNRQALYAGDSFIKPLLASALLVQAWVPDYAYYLNYPGWSLSVEAFLYFLFPFLFRLLRPVSTRRLLMVSGGGWLLNQGVQAYLNTTGVSISFINTFPPFHIATFVIGISMGICFVRHVAYLRQHRRVIGTGLLLAMVAGCLVLNTQITRIHHFEAGLFAPVFALLILYLSTQNNRIVRVFNLPTAVYLGEISYGMYILQAPVASLVRHTNKNWFNWPLPIAFPLLVVVLLLVAALCYEWVEKPGRNWLRQPLRVKASAPTSMPLSAEPLP